MRALLALILLASFSGCQIFGEDLDDSTGTFDYVARDVDGLVVAEGTLTLSFRDPSGPIRETLADVEGTFRVEASRGAHTALSGRGRIEGSIGQDSTLYVYPVPLIPDLGVTLTARVQGDIGNSFEGQWQSCGFGDCRVGGTFTATR